ncbi:MAG: hypothetical protein BAA04_08390 [Firmicutes bacterium ZCTH02-B6]|nr:MAG: hypothetical protein BAA04_08390 [Firmicutes bacterium ZCTH02-B6]
MHGWRSIIGSFILPVAAMLLLVSTARLQEADLPELTLDEIVHHVEAKLRTIKEIEVTVEVSQYNATDGSVTPGRGRLLAVLPDLYRFDWLEPDMLAGSILLVDVAKNEARQYNPIREEIIVQRWDLLAEQQNLGAEINRWLSLPNPEDYELSLGGVGYNDSHPHYVVLARPVRDPRQLYEFFVHPDSWMISQFRYYDVDGRLALHAVLRDVRINAGLDEDLVRSLPEAIVRHR